MNQFDQTNLGFIFENSEMYLLFGNRHATLDQLKKSYPEIQFHRVKQNHGDQVFQCNDVMTDWTTVADAQITELKKTALCISTADCIPVMIFDQRNKRIAAIHAGWRGVANQIALKTMQSLIEQNSILNDLKIYIGPHIQKESFEVGDDVAELIHQSIQTNLRSSDQHTVENKRMIDLHQIFIQQLLDFGIKLDQITDLKINTVTDLDFHSFRRDKEKSGRQLSFIFLK